MRRSAGFSVLLMALTALVAGLPRAEAASPQLRLITPRGVQRGAETVLRFTGARLQDAEQVLFYRPGVTATGIKPVNANAIDVTVQVAADCRLGEHVAQVRTKSGISDYRTFYVGPLPGIAEKEPNSEFDTPQAIELGVTIEGVVASEDVDYFRLNAKKGQRISVEVEAMRLGTTMFDPYVAILDSKRFELAAADDTPLVYQDAVASVVAPEDGEYTIEIRESAYGGNGNCRYRLHVGSFPRPTAVYPAGGKVGSEVSVTFIGDPAGDFDTKVKLPNAVEADFGLLPERDGMVAPSENLFRLSAHENVLEAEPNNDLATATQAELPLAFNGIIQEAGDYDFFKFTAKKGQVYEVECFARRIRSPLDAVMHIYKDGRAIVGSDDSRGPDSYLRFTVPADGEYQLRIYDHLQRGGPEFVYRVEFLPVEPKLSLSIPQTARYSQYRQSMFVPRGNRFATLLTISRQNFGGEIVLDGSDLPAGITMHTKTIPANMTSWPVVFEAAADAPLAGKLADLRAKLNDEKRNVTGRFNNTADLIVGSPGQSRYWQRDVDRLGFAVVEEIPFHIEIVQPEVPLVQEGVMNLKIVVKKKKGWDENITLEFPFRPPGVGTTSRITIPKGKTEGVYPLNANSKAAVGDWPVYVIGQAENGGASWAASQLATLKITPPYVKFALQRSTVEKGQPTEIVATIEQLTAFDGEATATLVGLPNKVAAEPLKFNKDTKELIFKVTTDPASPAGRHKTVFAQVSVPAPKEATIMHRNVGGTELRIDNPPPPPKDPPKSAPKPKVAVKKPDPPKTAAPPKRLTRLEQLRLDAEKRAAGK